MTHTVSSALVDGTSPYCPRFVRVTLACAMDQSGRQRHLMPHMIRSFRYLMLLSVVACGSLPGPADSGVDSGVDAGPCSPSMQTGCAADSKCTVRPDTGAPTCGPKGNSVAYASCAADPECIAGTTCNTAPAGNGTFERGQRCRPFCNPMTGGHLACALGGTCELVDTVDNSIGFCVRKADGGI